MKDINDSTNLEKILRTLWAVKTCFCSISSRWW